jgi:hypothetical protein
MLPIDLINPDQLDQAVLHRILGCVSTLAILGATAHARS